MITATFLVLVSQVLLQVSVHGSSRLCTWQGYRECANNLPSMGRVMPAYFSNDQLAVLCTTWGVQKSCIDELLDACEEQATDGVSDGSEASKDVQVGSLVVEEGSLHNDTVTTDPEDQSEQSSTAPQTTASNNPDSTPSPSTPAIKSTINGDGGVDAIKENSRTTRALLELKNSYKFFCDGYKKTVYRQEYRPCLVKKSSELRVASLECQSEYDNATMALNIDHPPHYQNICSAADVFYKCQSYNAREHCSGKASTWLKEYHMSLWKTSLQDLSCKKGRLLDEGSLGIVLVCACSLGVTIVLSLVSIYVVKPTEPSRFGEDDQETEKEQKQEADLQNGADPQATGTKSEEGEKATETTKC